MFTARSKQVNLYNGALMKFVRTKKCSRWTTIYFISNLSRKCDYTSVNTKIVYIPNLAQFMFIT